MTSYFTVHDVSGYEYAKIEYKYVYPFELISVDKDADEKYLKEISKDSYDLWEADKYKAIEFLLFKIKNKNNLVDDRRYYRKEKDGININIKDLMNYLQENVLNKNEVYLEEHDQFRYAKYVSDLIVEINEYNFIHLNLHYEGS